MKRTTKVLIAISILFVIAASSDSFAAKKNIFRGQGGATVSSTGLVIDASYDPRLDAFAEGYKVINVVLENRSFDIIYLDPERDKWSVKLKDKQKTVGAINNLKREAPKIWMNIPERARGLVGYPLVLPVGAREVFDLFIPSSYDLSRFNELHAYIRSLNSTFEILVTD